ncbi:MAG: CDP-alcohol phosphatidyltransferase family protein [Acidimicrobiia bacterium]|nr:CDP-alcohol phosphatidyltransferase family protein [Acidimicrobiia bacterium]MDH5615062.1 CDP-alcohol phosphatidyltransferase family protein [Acidimicrobiia bacterium]
MIETRVRPRISRALQAAGRVLAATGLKPTHLTVLGLLVTVGGAYLIGRNVLVAGGSLVAVGSFIDALDGPLARELGIAGPRGALLDSVTDRISETAMFAGVAYLVADEPLLVALAVAGLGAALVTSYLRAKAEGVGADGRAGLMGRAERVILYCLGVIAGFVGPMLWAMVILTWLTVVQRFAATWRQLEP